MSSFYVYAYLRSVNSKIAPAGTPFYIGKGTRNRAWKHCKNDCIQPPSDSTLIVILESNLTDVGAFALERRMIRWYGRVDNGTGILRNKTDGGEGTSGYKQNPEHIEKRCKPRPHLRVERIVKTYVCETCKKNFIRTYTAGNKHRYDNLHFCSPKCKNQNKAMQPKIPCKKCGRVFHPYHLNNHKCIET